VSTLDGLLKALAAEHAAVYVYGLLAARNSGRLRSSLTSAYNAHRRRRDQFRTLVTERGGAPVEAEVSYALPFEPDGSTESVRLATFVEEGVTAAYLELVAVEDALIRRVAAMAMQESVTRSYTLRPEIIALPGLRAPAPPPASTATPNASPTGTTSASPTGTTATPVPGEE
jgi:hypothetical protein